MGEYELTRRIYAHPLSPGWPAATYLSPPHVTSFVSSAPSTAAIESFMPFFLPERSTITEMALWLVTPQAGAECRLGLYRNNNLGRPSTLMIDAGTLDLSSGTDLVKSVSFATPLTIGRGWIWSCCQLKNLATQITCLSLNQTLEMMIPRTTVVTSAVGGRHIQRAVAYGSPLLDTAASNLVAAVTAAPAIWLKKAA